MTTDIRREHTRLSFPDAAPPAPRLETGGRTYEIIDLSPGGIRFRLPEGAPGITIGEVVRATIRFPPDRNVVVRGLVLRISGDQIAARLEQGGPARLNGDSAVRRRPGGMLW